MATSLSDGVGQGWHSWLQQQSVQERQMRRANWVISQAADMTTIETDQKTSEEELSQASVSGAPEWHSSPVGLRRQHRWQGRSLELGYKCDLSQGTWRFPQRDGLEDDLVVAVEDHDITSTTLSCIPRNMCSDPHSSTRLALSCCQLGYRTRVLRDSVLGVPRLDKCRRIIGVAVQVAGMEQHLTNLVGAVALFLLGGLDWVIRTLYTTYRVCQHAITGSNQTKARRISLTNAHSLTKVEEIGG
ncbi:hypothetical protein I7I51_02177 [Histoplasma capsulatum]|uniref:Uncharacterized protein n=1 Tax=Ajellomyces capsulatus TaxID=5037 RepID=A0A8A1MB34_AJECA|nr:hypothetical protein I7I51_02177 [Histoplasma capsulatum]